MESSEPDPREPDEPSSSESSSEWSSEPPDPDPEPPFEGSVVGGVGWVGCVVGSVVGVPVVGSVAGLVGVVVPPPDPLPEPPPEPLPEPPPDPLVDPEPPPVVALPDVVPPAGLDPFVTGPMNTPSTPSCLSGLQLSEPLRSSAEICEQVTVSMVPGVAATATP